MIVYSCLKKNFINSVNNKTISNLVYSEYKNQFHQKTKLSQIKAWANSLPALEYIIEALPDNIGISIEYLIPLTNKRVDVILSGFNIYHKPTIILLELKQWQYAKKVQKEDAIVKTLIGKKEINVLHPAYQVLTYKELIENYNIEVEKNNINIIPIVYLHNYNLALNDEILDNKYKPYYKKALMFGNNNKEELKYFIENNLCFGDNLNIINTINNSDIKPTKKLTNVIWNMINTKKEFTLLDEQKIIMEQINKIVLDTYKTAKKTVIIINGGPGTGKSVLAIHALGELLSLGLIGAYVSKNMAPRNVYKSLLASKADKIKLNNLFKSSSFFVHESFNKYDFLLVDEAHRLQEKSGIHNNYGENQIKEIMNASKCSIFFVDENQIITLKDIGTIDNIKNNANSLNTSIYEFELISEFRCNGSNSYLDFIESFLYNKKKNITFNFDFQVIDSPKELYELIKLKNTNNNARLVAGFCWNRYSKEADNQDYHDVKIGDFSLSWNLKHGEEFATRQSAINEIGCIYNVQGLEFDYIGVIIGPDLKYQNGKVTTDYHARANTEKSLYGLQVLIKEDKEKYEKMADTIIRNTYRVLLTRGIKGCYVYACDENLQNYLKKITKQNIVI